MRKPLRDLLDDLAADLYDEGRHNEAELLEELSNRVRNINFRHADYTLRQAVSTITEDEQCDQRYCDCERCPHCGGLVDE